MMGPDWMDVDGVASFIAHSDSSYAGRVLLLEDLEINALVAAGKIENDPIEREKIYGELQDKLAEHLVYLPMVQATDFYFHQEYIVGMESHYFHSISWWLVSTK